MKMTDSFSGSKFDTAKQSGKIVEIKPEDVSVMVEKKSFEMLMRNNHLYNILMTLGLGQTDIFVKAMEEFEKTSSEENAED